MTNLAARRGELTLTRNLLNFLTDRSPRRVMIWSGLTLLLVAVVGMIVVYDGPSHIMAPWDVFTLLDGAWRIVSGQIPHTDFHNPIGPLTYEMVALGMRVAGPSLSAVVYAEVAGLAVATSWAWLIARRRLSGLNRFLFTVFVALLVVATRPLGFDPAITTYALLYNRYGWVLYCLLLVELFVEPRAGSRVANVLEGVSIGLLLGLLFFDKVTYFAVGLLATGLQLLLRRSSWLSMVGQLVGFVMVCLGMRLAFQISVLNYLKDILSAGRAQSLLLRLHFLGSSLKHNWLMIILIGAITLVFYLVAVKPASRGAGWARPYVPLVIAGFCLASAFLIESGNASEGSDLPATFVVGIVLLEAVAQGTDWLATDRLTALQIWYLATWLVTAVAFAGPIMLKDGLSLVQTTLWRGYRLSSASASQRFESDALADFVIPASSEWQTAYWSAEHVPGRINDGLSLLRKHITNHSRIFTMALTNPFAIALELPPPQGTLAWWDLNFSISDHSFPSAADTFGDVDLVMIPVLLKQDAGCCQETVQRMLENFGPYLQAHFVQLDQTPYWILMERRH